VYSTYRQRPFAFRMTATCPTYPAPRGTIVFTMTVPFGNFPRRRGLLANTFFRPTWAFDSGPVLRNGFRFSLGHFAYPFV